MKLNEKDLKRIQDEMEHGEYQIPCGYENVEGMSIYHLEEHEFETDDFKGIVCLTVEEAKGLLEISRDYRMCLFNYWRIPLSLSSNEAFTALRERIEQVEATNTQEKIKRLEKEITRLKADQARDDRAKERFLNSLED